MTDISVRRSGPFTAEDRSWLASLHGTEIAPGITVDTALFTGALRSGDVIKSGLVLGKVTATGLYGPYDAAASDGRQNAAGLLFQSIDVSNGDRRFGTGLFVHGFVYEAKLPVALTNAARSALTHIVFA